MTWKILPACQGCWAKSSATEPSVWMTRMQDVLRDSILRWSNTETLMLGPAHIPILGTPVQWGLLLGNRSISVEGAESSFLIGCLESGGLIWKYEKIALQAGVGDKGGGWSRVWSKWNGRFPKCSWLLYNPAKEVNRPPQRLLPSLKFTARHRVGWRDIFPGAIPQCSGLTIS